jgi:hypothetical protein
LTDRDDILDHPTARLEVRRSTSGGCVALPSLLRQNVPPVGTVYRLARELYNPADRKATRRAVVVGVAAGSAIMVTRTTSNPWPGDIKHDAEPDCGCTEPGWWQPLRWYRIPFEALDRGGPEARKYDQPLNETTVGQVVAAWQKRGR